VKTWRIRWQVFVSLLVTAICCLLLVISPILHIGENWLNDLRVSHNAQVSDGAKDIVIIEITEATLAKFPYRSPIDRGFLLEILQRFESIGVQSVGIDLLFDQPTEPFKDKALFKWLHQTDMPVVVASAELRDGLTKEQKTYLKKMTSGLRQGSARVEYDSRDGMVRHVPLRISESSGVILGLAAQLAGIAGVTIPNQHLLRLDTMQRPRESKSFFRTFEIQHIPLLPAAWFKDRIILIGQNLPLADRHRSPVSIQINQRDVPGVILHGLALTQLLDQRFLWVSPFFLSLGILWFMCLAGTTLTNIRTSVVNRLFLITIITILFWIINWYLSAEFKLLLPVLLPTFGYFLAASISAIRAWNAENIHKKFLKKAFSKYLAPQVIAQISSNPEKLVTGGEKRELTFLFTDLQDFTGLTESLQPGILVSLLNNYLDEVCAVVLKHEGTLDKIVGDALHVFFNAPLNQQDHAQKAVKCALALDACCEALRKKAKQENINLGVTRIGIHTGIGIVGNYGGKERFDYTAHGDAVNTAARLESVNKHFGSRICVSESTANRCKNLNLRPIGNLLLKGKKQAIMAYEILTSTQNLAPTADYRKAYLAMNGPSAIEAFGRLRQSYQDDYLVRFHYNRLSKGETGSTITLKEK